VVNVLFYDVGTVDCTADPHYVPYDTMEEMLDAIQCVSKSDLVHAITDVRVEYERNGVEEIFESDDYTDWDGGGKYREAVGKYAEKHKIEGLYFRHDADVDNAHHLLPGLSGVKQAADIIRKRYENGDLPSYLGIGVVWSFAMQHSCSDWITANFHRKTVDFSNQDWYIGNENYHDHIAKLSGLVGFDIEPSEVG